MATQPTLDVTRGTRVAVVVAGLPIALFLLIL
jgi:hypothetical protein